MANVIITLKLMPESPEVNLDYLTKKAQELIIHFAGEGEMRIEKEPIAFGLVALKITFVADEKKGGTEKLESQIAELPGIQSVECTDVRRAVG